MSDRWEGGSLPIESIQETGSKDERIAALIEMVSAYVEQYHNGSVKMVSRIDDTVYVELGGACVGCSMSPATLCGWVLGTVKQFFPEINRIEEYQGS